MTNKMAKIETKVRILSTLTTRDEGGRHFTEWISEEEIAALEAAGLIEVHCPTHDSTGIPYGHEHWSVEITQAGVDLVDAYPEYCEA